MTIESDLKTALAAVAGGRVYPLVAPENVVKPFVTYKAQVTPIVMLSGAEIGRQTLITLECWGETFASALSTAAAVRAAIVASALVCSAIESPEDGYAPETDEYVRPVSYLFTQ